MSLKKLIMAITGVISVTAAVIAVLPKAQVIWEFFTRDEPILELAPITIEVNSRTQVDWVQHIYTTKPSVKDDFILELVTSNVDLTLVGKYEIVLNVKTPKGNTYDYPLEVSVVDTTPPVFSIFGLTLEKGTTNQIDWISHVTGLSDNSNQTVHFSVRNGLPLNASIGTYTVILIGTDLYGNSTEKSVEIQVVDTTKPVIVANNIQLNYKSEPLNWISLFEVIDASTTTKEITYNNLNLNKIGVYQLELTATDSFNNVQTKSITVEVIPLTIDSIVIISQSIVKTGDTCTHYVLGACTGADQYYSMDVNLEIVDLGYTLEYVAFFYFDPWTDKYVRLGSDVKVFGEYTFSFDDIHSRYDLSHTDANLSLHSYKLIYYYRNPNTNLVVSFEYIYNWK